MAWSFAVGNSVKPCFGFIYCFYTTLNYFFPAPWPRDIGLEGFTVLVAGFIWNYIIIVKSLNELKNNDSTVD